MTESLYAGRRSHTGRPRPERAQGYGTPEVRKDGVILTPRKSQLVLNHSPDGFEWGYGGSGPAQLALALLLEETDKDTALGFYHSFKRDVVANFAKDGWAISSRQIQEWLTAQRGAA